MIFKECLKLNSMGFANIFDAKVVNHQAKDNSMTRMAQETKGGGTLIVVVLFETFFDDDVC